MKKYAYAFALWIIAILLAAPFFFYKVESNEQPLVFRNIPIYHPTSDDSYKKVCMDGIEYYRMGRGAAPVVDKETLSFVRCGE
ncbi:hypothetical protein VPFG_00061 [Vibrio phage nt-1]|uniref:Uncharacterized protein n=1 Tax=Vibrio phage nt-1 TaxID=115992 RepID=R9TF39_9CAUD|nr:hypothetical protein VPFG_00061 [Vibrio phage nt-1]AGN30064.1 hypothetical protein VPFG_00061 [Vibrio phage nt-1]